jgi:hypothetical protein
MEGPGDDAWVFPIHVFWSFIIPDSWRECHSCIPTYLYTYPRADARTDRKIREVGDLDQSEPGRLRINHSRPTTNANMPMAQSEVNDSVVWRFFVATRMAVESSLS